MPRQPQPGRVERRPGGDQLLRPLPATALEGNEHAHLLARLDRFPGERRQQVCQLMQQGRPERLDQKHRAAATLDHDRRRAVQALAAAAADPHPRQLRAPKAQLDRLGPPSPLEQDPIVAEHDRAHRPRPALLTKDGRVAAGRRTTPILHRASITQAAGERLRTLPVTRTAETTDPQRPCRRPATPKPRQNPQPAMNRSTCRRRPVNSAVDPDELVFRLSTSRHDASRRLRQLALSGGAARPPAGPVWSHRQSHPACGSLIRVFPHARPTALCSTSGRVLELMHFRVLTALAAVSVWALLAVGGVVRVTESGLGCPHWPLCAGRAIPLDRRASLIEYSHRALVALVIVLVGAVAVQAWRRQRSRPELLWPALAALALLPVQALLGAIAVWLELPGWLVGFHFLVGLLFLGTVVLTAAAAWRRPQPSSSAGFALLARVAVLVGLALASVGAAVVATDADRACGTQWPACNGGFATGGGHAELQVAHRMLAYTLAALAAALFLLALRGHGPRLAGTLPVLAGLAQIGLGIAIVLVGGNGRAHQILAGTHEAGAGLVWALLVTLAALTPPAARASGRHAAESVSERKRLYFLK